jgi:hypothetical protein
VNILKTLRVMVACLLSLGLVVGLVLLVLRLV